MMCRSVKVMLIMVFSAQLSVFFVSCAGPVENKHAEPKAKAPDKPDETVPGRKKDTLMFVDDCSTEDYVATLEENRALDSNASILSVEERKSDKVRKFTVDLPASLSHIDYCTSDYVVHGFACGGPCYAKTFVFINENRKNETYGYCQPVTSVPYLITHIENEDFEDLRVRNLKNGKELKVDISDCEQLSVSPCYMDTMYVKNHRLILKYDKGSGGQKKQSVNLEPIGL